MKQILPGLHLINLDQPIEGFRDFISTWLYQKNEVTILIDPGPSSTILHLCSVLKKLKVKKIDLILLTHIHIDHAGGTGLLLKKFPQARVICHPKAIKHLVNPEKLWAASLQVLGKLAEVYGPVTPVSPNNLEFNKNLQMNDLIINAVETPGHAAHHLIYKIDDLLFLGEVAGVNIPLKNHLYLRIATPPVFKYEIYSNSLQIASKIKAKHFCFGHYGYRNDGPRIFKQAFEQLELWMEIIQKSVTAQILDEEIIFNELLRVDPQLKHFKHLPSDIQSREHYFCKNSIRGILDYLTKM